MALAWGTTWLLSLPLVWNRVRGLPPRPFTVALAALSAFGPSVAAFLVARRQRRLREVFGRFRTHPLWLGAGLLAPMSLHLIARVGEYALGGHVARWLWLPRTSSQLAALVVFSLGEEFGWRGFAHPRMVQRFGPVWGCLLLGVVWGLWHLIYSVTPERAGFDGFGFAMTMLELPLYALVIGWLFERANRSMAVAIAFHAGAHLDHFERAPRTDLRLHVLHLLVLAAAAAGAAWALSRRPSRR